MKKIGVYDVFIWFITIVLIAGIFMLPNTVPVHFDVHWNADRYGSRYEFLIVALLPILVYYGMLLTKKIDPHQKGIEAKGKTYDLIRKGLSFVMVLLAGFLYTMILNPSMDGTFIMSIIFGILFVLIGNYMPRIPQNYFLGIKTPWTLESEYVWKRTHYIGGYVFVVSGVILMVGGLFSSTIYFVILLVVALIDVLFCFVYSYMLFKKQESLLTKK